MVPGTRLAWIHPIHIAMGIYKEKKTCRRVLRTFCRSWGLEELFGYSGFFPIKKKFTLTGMIHSKSKLVWFLFRQMCVMQRLWWVVLSMIFLFLGADRCGTVDALFWPDIVVQVGLFLKVKPQLFRDRIDKMNYASLLISLSS